MNLLDPLGLFTPKPAQGASGASGAQGAGGADGAPQDPLSAALALPKKIHEAVSGILGGVLGGL